MNVRPNQKGHWVDITRAQFFEMDWSDHVYGGLPGDEPGWDLLHIKESDGTKLARANWTSRHQYQRWIPEPAGKWEPCSPLQAMSEIRPARLVLGGNPYDWFEQSPSDKSDKKVRCRLGYGLNFQVERFVATPPPPKITNLTAAVNADGNIVCEWVREGERGYPQTNFLNRRIFTPDGKPL